MFRTAVVALAAIVCVFISVAMIMGHYNDFQIATDFAVYWRTANEPASAAYVPSTTLPFPYSPTMLLWISPLSLMPMWTAFVLWIASSVGALAWACRRHLSAPEFGFTIVSPPVAFALATGQVSVALTALLLWACGTPNRAAAGLALGIIASIKPQLVLMAPLLLLFNRDWRALIAAAVSFAAIVTLSVVLFGPARWPEWIASMSHFHQVLIDLKFLGGAATPASVAEYRGLPPLPFLIMGVGIACWLAFQCRARPPLECCAAIATASLLAAPYGFKYDLSAIVPFFAWSIFRGRFWPAAALVLGGLQPLPLVVATAELARRAHLRSWTQVIDRIKGMSPYRGRPNVPSEQ